MAKANKIAQELAFLPEIESGPKSVRSIKKFIEQIAGQVSNVMDNIGKVAFSDKDLSRISAKMKKLATDITQARTDGNKVQEQQLQDLFQTEKKHLEAVIKRRKEAQDVMKGEGEVGRMEKSGAVGADFAKTVSAAFSDVLSGDLGNIGDLVKRMGTQMKKSGFAAQAKETDESVNGASAGMAGLLRAIGPAIIAIGALAAGFAAIVKLIMDADAQTKEWNRALMEGGAAVGDITSRTDMLEDSLGTLREAAADFGNNVAWGTLADEQLKLLGAWSEAGFTLKEMRTQIKGAKTDIEAYQTATAAALTYSKLLGESAESVGKEMAERMEDLGVSLDGIKERYAAIYEAAQLSGFGTKRFFGMVLQATSGMTMYNVRMEEAATLMMRLSKVLGSKVGAEFFQNLTKGFSAESFQDRYKRVLVTGQKATQRIMATSAQESAADFAGKLGTTFKDSKKLGEALQAGLGKSFGIDDATLKKLSGAGSEARQARADVGKQIVDKLKDMSPKEAAKALAAMREKMPADMARQFENLLDVSKGSGGRLDDMVKGLAGLDPGATLAMQMEIAKTQFGRPLHELSTKQLMAFESFSSMSGEQLEQLRRVSRFSQGGWDRLKDVQKEFKKLSPEEQKARNKELAEAYGVIINEQGKIMKAQADGSEQGFKVLDKEITDQQAFLKSQSDALSSIDKAMSKQEEMALKVASNTTDMAKYIKIGVEQFLMKIYNAVASILTWVSGGMDKDEKKNKDEALKAMRKQEQEQMETRIALAGGLKDLEKKLDQAVDPKDKALLTKQVADKRAELDAADRQFKMTERLIEAIQAETEGYRFSDKTAEEITASALKKIGNAYEDREKALETLKDVGGEGAVSAAMEKGKTIALTHKDMPWMKSFQEKFDEGLEKLEKERGLGGEGSGKRFVEGLAALRKATIDSEAAQVSIFNNQNRAITEALRADSEKSSAAQKAALKEDDDKKAARQKLTDEIMESRLPLNLATEMEKMEARKQIRHLGQLAGKELGEADISDIMNTGALPKEMLKGLRGMENNTWLMDLAKQGAFGTLSGQLLNPEATPMSMISQQSSGRTVNNTWYLQGDGKSYLYATEQAQDVGIGPGV